MTEQQFEKLKTLLHSSDVTQNSEELDNKILNAAKLNANQSTAKQVQSEGGRNGFMAWLVDFFQAGFIQSAVLSVTLTLILFFVLGQVLKPDYAMLNGKEAIALHEKGSEIFFDIELAKQADDAVLSDSKFVEAGVLPEPETVPPRDQILAQMNLPDIQELLNGMNFNEQTDRQFAESLISLAMSDIEVMLESGKLDNARERYVQLKQNCDVCTLPNTLEALALEYVKRPDNT